MFLFLVSWCVEMELFNRKDICHGENEHESKPKVFKG